MIPLRDTIPSSSFPVVTIGLITMNVLAFLYELSLGRELDVFVMKYGVVPYTFVHAGQWQQVSLLGRFHPLLVSMFLHGGWLHLLGNMLYLWIFGDNVEDRLGHGRFLLFLRGAATITAYMTGGVAWWAHIGGFVSGMALGYLFPKPQRQLCT